MPQKKIAVINDLSGYGRCSLTVALPLLSAHGLQACPVPTAVFSNHTGFSSFFVKDLTDILPAYLMEWKKRSLAFDGILSSFLNTPAQVELVLQFLKEFQTPQTTVFIDPVMGDHGRAYRTVTPELCNKMKELVPFADVLTPNLTEACLLTDTPYSEKLSRRELAALAKKLIFAGAKKVVITGIVSEQFITNVCLEKGKEPVFLRNKKEAAQISGTGDVFSSVLAAEQLNGNNFSDSVKKAADFVRRSILATVSNNTDPKNGVCFEALLSVKK